MKLVNICCTCGSTFEFLFLICYLKYMYTHLYTCLHFCLNFFFLSQGLDTSPLTPVMPVRSLTPALLQSRERFGASTASSQSCMYLSSMESECCSSPRLEKDVKVRTVSFFYYKLKLACTSICMIAGVFISFS